MCSYPNMTASVASPSLGQHSSQETEATNMPHDYFPAYSQPLPTPAQLRTTLSGHNHPSSWSAIPQSLCQFSPLANGSSRMQPYIQSAIAQPNLTAQNTGISRIYSYEQFISGGLNTRGQSVAVDTFPAQLSHTSLMPQPSMANYRNYGSNRYRSIAANTDQNTQNSGSGTDIASVKTSYAEAQANPVPTVIGPSMAGNGTPSHVVQVKTTMKPYPIGTPQAHTASSVAPNSLAANLRFQPPHCRKQEDQQLGQICYRTASLAKRSM